MTDPDMIFYAINPKKFEKEMDWKPLFSLKDDY